MIYQVITYLKWFPKTFHLHGIHSPFIYALEKKGLRQKPPHTIIKAFKNYRNSLLQDTQEIEVKDYGAGSRVFKSATRKVSDIAQLAGASQKRMYLLYQLKNYFNAGHILELGTSVGISTVALAIDQKSKVTTIEGCPQTAAVAQTYFKQESLANVEQIVHPFKKALQHLQGSVFDLIYFDGNHSKEATLAYVYQLLPTVHNDTVWIFDDIHWSKEMTAAWKTIQQLPQVTATIDGFWFGIVFFRKEQRKEEFQIRL